MRIYTISQSSSKTFIGFLKSQIEKSASGHITIGREDTSFSHEFGVRKQGSWFAHGDVIFEIKIPTRMLLIINLHDGVQEPLKDTIDTIDSLVADTITDNRFFPEWMLDTFVDDATGNSDKNAFVPHVEVSVKDRDKRSITLQGKYYLEPPVFYA